MRRPTLTTIETDGIAGRREREARILDWATVQLQREHARVFDAIARLRAAATKVRG